ncbi:MAG: phenazine biosynthesis protein PhzF family [Solirubrobacterales bacterium]|nr:phenazine biosynthesis protein PhzF family [Solirubrobacterales bacterium]
MRRAFEQVDVFTTEPYRGNPVAVVLDGEGLGDAEMQQVAAWTNLSETTFVLPPTQDGADYRVRIFTPTRELPFAGHPTLGTCHAWLRASGSAAAAVVQECAAGLVAVRRGADGLLAFAAPPVIRDGPLGDELLAEVAATLRIDAADIVDAAWAVNGPEWIAVLLRSAEEVLAVRPGYADLDIGIAGPHPAGSEIGFEVRAFFPKDGTYAEDPVTGSFNASLAGWLLGSGRASAPYVAAQGTVLERAGRIHVDRDDHGQIWVGGGTVTCVAGTVDI